MRTFLNQSLSIISLSIIIAFFVNLFREDNIGYMAKDLDTTNLENILTSESYNPLIRSINIETAQKLHSQSTIFVDARAMEYYINGHILGAICNDDFDTLAVDLMSLIGEDMPFVVYCSDDDCGSSEDLAYQLQDYGFTNILLFKGGWKEWQDNGLPEGLK